MKCWNVKDLYHCVIAWVWGQTKRWWLSFFPTTQLVCFILWSGVDIGPMYHKNERWTIFVINDLHWPLLCKIYYRQRLKQKQKGWLVFSEKVGTLGSAKSGSEKVGLPNGDTLLKICGTSCENWCMPSKVSWMLADYTIVWFYHDVWYCHVLLSSDKDYIVENTRLNVMYMYPTKGRVAFFSPLKWAQRMVS